MEGEGAGELALDDTNLVIRAVAGARRGTPGAPPHARLHLRKQIPLAGGLAGGSADAAATLVACDALWGTGLARDELAGIAAGLGSDVPFLVLRRHRAGHRPRRGGQPGAGPPATPGTGWSPSPTAACPPRRSTGELDRLRDGRRRAAAARQPRRAAGRAAPAGPGGARRGARQRPAGRRAGAAPGAGRHARGRRRPPARSPGSSPAPARPACSSPRDAARTPTSRRRRRCRGAAASCRAGARGRARARCAGRPVDLTRRWPTSSIWTGWQGVRRGRPAAHRRLARPRRRRPGRRGRPQRRRQVHPAAPAHQGRGARRRPGHPPPRPAGAPRCRRRSTSRPTPPSGTWCSAPPGCRRRSRAEHEWAGDAGVRTVLDGLGMPHLGLDAAGRPDVRRRAPPGRAGRAAGPRDRPADPRRADQPPRRGRRRLAGRAPAAAARGALVVVTHDRWFLDAVCTATWEVADRTVRAYEGGYAAWTLARAERERVAAAAEARRQNLLRKEIAWLRRGPPARTSKPQVPHRRRERADRRRAAGRATPCRCSGWPPPGWASRCTSWTDVTLRAGPEADPATTSTWLVGPGDRIAHRGRQRRRQDHAAAAARRASRTPRRRAGWSRGSTVRPAFLSQELAELPGRPAGARGGGGGRPAGPARRPGAVRRPARRGVRLHRPAALDPGRRTSPAASGAGCRLLRLLAGEPNVLLLDEPTNDLDTDTLAALEDLLDSWPGTMIVASHDRYLVERVADTVVRRCSATAGWCTCPAASTSTSARAAEPGRLAARAGRGRGRRAPAPAAGGRAVRRRAAVGPQGAGPAGAADRASSTQREAALHEQLAAHATDYARVAELDAQLQAVRAERERIEEAWLTLAERSRALTPELRRRRAPCAGVAATACETIVGDPTRTALETQTMAHTPVNHPARPIYRAIGGLTGLYLVVFGVLGVIASTGDEFFAQDDTAVLGQGTNLGLLGVCHRARRGSSWSPPRRPQHRRRRQPSGSAYLLMVLGLATLAVLRTDANSSTSRSPRSIVSMRHRPGAADGRHVRQGRHRGGVRGLAEGPAGALDHRQAVGRRAPRRPPGFPPPARRRSCGADGRGGPQPWRCR